MTPSETNPPASAKLQAAIDQMIQMQQGLQGREPTFQDYFAAYVQCTLLMHDLGRACALAKGIKV